MHVLTISLLVLTCAMCAFAVSDDTVLTRVTRTLPFDASFLKWPALLRYFWSTGRIWELPRNGAMGLLRLLSSPDTRKTMIFEFKPDDGPRASLAYQQRYGYRGQWLIELLGAGYHPDSLRYQQPFPAFVLTPPPPPPPL